MRKKYIKASFTIELSYILFVIFMGIANLILYVHREKISTACKYLVHQIAVELASREEVFDEDGEFDKTIKEKFSLLGAMEEDFSGVKIEIDRKIDRKMDRTLARLISPNMDIRIEQKLFKQVEIMRAVSAIKRIINEK